MWQQRNHPVKSLSPLDSQKKIWWCYLLGVSRNSILGVLGIFLAKKSFENSKFIEGIFFTWPLFSHFVRVLEYI
jgi:hypothetical protein